jgi:hypothetical protein
MLGERNEGLDSKARLAGLYEGVHLGFWCHPRGVGAAAAMLLDRG